MTGKYHDESYQERMEAQHGVYEGNEPPMLFPSDVDAALRRIEEAIDDGATMTSEIKNAITRERERLGLPKELKI